MLVVLLLVLQAWCDLALPEYTSKIIDTGILHSGVEHVLPPAMEAEEFSYATLFMTEEEAARWGNCYEQDGDIFRLTEKNDKKLNQLDQEFMLPVLLNYQMAAVEKTQFLKQFCGGEGQSEEVLQATKLETVWEVLGLELPVKEVESVQYVDVRPLMLVMAEQGALTEETVLASRETAVAMFDAMGDTVVKSMGITYATQCASLAGLNMEANQSAYMWKTGGKMLAMTVLMVGSMIGIGFLSARIGAGIGKNLRQDIFGRVVEFTNAEMDQFSTASLITRSTNDVQQVQNTSVMMMRMVLYAPIVGIGGVIKVYQTGAGLGWVIGAAVGIIIALVAVLMVIAMPKFKMMQVLFDRLNLVSREILTGLPVIRAFGRERTEEMRFDRANRNVMSTSLFTGRVMNFLMPTMTLLMNGLSVAIIWFSSLRIDAGTMQVGTMTAFITYAMQIVMSFLMLTMMSIMLPRAIVAANRIDEVLTTETSIRNPEQPEEMKEKKGVVSFEHVNFRYPGAEEDVLCDIDFVAEPGKTTAIIGSTGCGKTTLLNLIPRLYDVRTGSVKIDGQDVRNLDLAELRDMIGYVPQKGLLFSGTIESNLRYGDGDAAKEQLERAARIAQAEEFILEKENQYEAPIAQGGTNVSGGQKQRLAIARAVVKNPQIFLFDDSFSALDMKTDAVLRKALKEEVKDSTVIIVAQRISTILQAEQILVLEEGVIVGKGTHEELLADCEVYRQIATSQLSEKELGLEGKEVQA